MATLDRRTAIAAFPALWLAACEPKMPLTVSTTPKMNVEAFDRAVADIARAAAPGVMGVGLLNLESGETYLFNGGRSFPMESVFKLPLAAAFMAEVDAGRAALDEEFVLIAEQLSPPWSPIAAAWPETQRYTARELLRAILVDSDNTAADVLMKRIGGPGAVTAWLATRRLGEIRVDRYERELQCEAHGMPPFRPAWRTPAAFEAARAAVPVAARFTALRTEMADPRDTTTPRAMLDFLQVLDREELVAPNSCKLILELMGQSARGTDRIAATLPKGSFLAHRPGTSGVEQGISAAHNDVGIFTLPDRRSYALAVFLSGSTRDDAGRDRIIAQVAGAAVKAVG